jgi:hypothetical protein
MSAITEKLQKLVAMMNGAKAVGNQAEAEAFAAKVAELMLKYKLEMSDVEQAEQAKDNPFGTTESRQKHGVTPAWRMVLSGAIAKSMFCRRFYRSGANLITFVGRNSDRAACVALYEHLAATGKKLCSTDFRKRDKKAMHGYTDFEWKKAYMVGYADGIAARLKEQHRVMLEGSSTGTAMVLREEHALTEYIEMAMRISHGHGRKVAHVDSAYAQGKHRGSTVSMEHAGPSKLRLGAGK